MVSRLGGQAVYDTDLDITWLADANAGAGSIFDDGASTTDGLMTWANANAWAASLTVGGLTDWRLPTALNSDGTGPCTGLNCTESEVGHLAHNELGGGILSGDPDLVLFSNLPTVNGDYWLATESNLNTAFLFNVFVGGQGTGLKSNDEFAWAVRSGDVSTVPVPAAVWLFGSGLAGLISMSRRKAVV